MVLLDRRQFLTAAAGLAGSTVARAARPAPGGETVAFFLVGDTHFLAEKENPSRLDARSAAVTGRLIDVLNRLPGSAISSEAGGGIVLAPKGVIHAGDCIDTGDKSSVKMQQTEWAAFADVFGLNGSDGKLKVPVYEVHGNHDSPRGDGMAIGKIVERNRTRPGLVNLSGNGLHYSWDWGRVHFVNLGIVVGRSPAGERRRRYAPLGSLDFLVNDLRDKVGESGRPVVITHHIDVLRYAKALPVEDKDAEKMEWDPADVKGFHDALRDYNVAAILYGHTHARNVVRWDGSTKPAGSGLPLFNVDNSSHFSGPAQAFFYFEINEDALRVREYQTTDAWETGDWTPRTWSMPLTRTGI